MQISRDLNSLVIEGLGHSFVSSAQLGLCNAHAFFKCVCLFLQPLDFLEGRLSFFIKQVILNFLKIRVDFLKEANLDLEFVINEHVNFKRVKCFFFRFDDVRTAYLAT